MNLGIPLKEPYRMVLRNERMNLGFCFKETIGDGL